MADSYSIIDGQVAPYYGGRKGTNTDAWRDATPLELQLQEQLAEAEQATAAKDAEIEALRAEVLEAREGWHMANGAADLAMKHRDAAEARAERLAEALRLALKWAEVLPTGEPLRADSVRDLDNARAALEQEAGRG